MSLPANLKPTDLIGDPDAYFFYLLSLAPEQACEWLIFAADQVPTKDWLDLAVGATMSGTDLERAPTLERVAALLVQRLTAEPSPDGLHDLLREIVQGPTFRSTVPAVAGWLADRAGAGDAPVVVAWLNATEADIPEAVRLKLKVRLLERGWSELRRRENHALLERILLDVDGYRPELRETALRAFLQCDHAVATMADPHGEMMRPAQADERIAGLLGVVERVLGDQADASLAWDMASVLGWRNACTVAFGEPDLARTSAALIARIVDQAEEIGQGFGVSGCLYALFESQHELPRLRSPRAVADAISVATERRPLGVRRPDPAKLLRWTRTTVDSWFDVHGLCRGDTSGMDLLDRVSSRHLPWLLEAPALYPAIRAALDSKLAGDEGPHLRAARVILEAHPDEPGAVVPAVWALPARDPRRALHRARTTSADEIAAALNDVFIRSWPRPTFGVPMGELLNGVLTVKLDHLADERKYELRDRTLFLDERSVLGLIDGFEPREALAIACLYVAHELAHGAQGLADKERVAAVRAAGGEATLMHLDLAADHAATRIVHEARREWSVNWLKDLYAVSTRRFPVGPNHIAAARARKLGRALALRADYLMRAHSLTAPTALAEGYAFVEMGPGGGSFVALCSQPPITVLGAAALSPEDATLLARAADKDAPSTTMLDEVLLRVLRAGCGGAASTPRPSG